MARREMVVYDLQFPTATMCAWFKRNIVAGPRPAGEWLPDGSLRVLRADRYHQILDAAEGREVKA